MDCSGLVYVSFKKEQITLPRVSRDMAKKGKLIPVSEAKKGDLLFFKTNKNRSVINHVGLVVDSKNGEVYFIHATTSKGVIISSLHEKYWKRAFIEARKVI
jgi:cell wall-associated NlpC family hydrolase